METRIDVKMVKVDFECPKCKNGFLRHTGAVLTTYPPMYPHHCNNPECDYGETFTDKSYPYIDHEEI